MKKAKWIWIDDVNAVNQYVDFYMDFVVSSLKTTHLLALSVTGNYALYVNDELVCCARFDDFPEFKFFDEIDISKYLKKGINSVKVCAYAFNLGTYRSLPMKPAFIAEITDSEGEVVACTGCDTACSFSPFYKSGFLPKFAAGNQFSVELFPEQVHEERHTATLIEVDYKLFKRPIKLCVLGDDLLSKLVDKGSFEVDSDLVRNEKLQNAKLFSGQTNGDKLYFIFDLGSVTNGYLKFDFDLIEDAEVELVFGEHFTNGRVCASLGGRDFTHVIHAKKGKNDFTDYLNRFGLRYIQVYVYSSYCNIRYFGMRYTEYPLTEYPLLTDNQLRQKIYKASVKTLKECMHEHYEDCPFREQALYAMDSRNQMLCGYYTFKEYSFARASIELLLKRIHVDGHTYLTAPCDRITTIPCFTLVTFLMLKEYTEHSNDKTLAEELWDKITFIIEKFSSFVDEAGLLPRFKKQGVWNFYEWTEGMWNEWGDHPLAEGSVEYPSVLNAFFVIALESYSWLANKLGKPIANCEEKIKKIKEKMFKFFWSKEKECFGAYLTDGKLTHFNELANSMMLYVGVGDRDSRIKVSDKLASGKLSEMTLSMMIYKYQALIDMDEKYIEYVNQDIDKKWGYMISKGATTFWETLKGAEDFGGAGSLCHGWSAIPAYFYKKNLKG